jgi:2',3'-cyclic-nucleotide 2'-phosphodiesterase (5'-nucleotidase family)
VILAAHLGGGTANTWVYSSNAIVGMLTGVDVVIDAHSHEVYNLSIPDKDGKMIPIAQTGTKMQNIGQLTIYKDGHIEEKLIDQVPLIPGFSGESVTRKGVDRYVDPDMKAFIDDIIESYDGLMSRKIGDLSVDLSKEMKTAST